MPITPFWEAKSLESMTDKEWESLCDGCGQCCLHKLINDDTADVFYTRVACALLHDDTGRCSRYTERFKEVEDCLDVKRMSRDELAWMPRSCAYRRLAEGKALPAWHPLITGDQTSVFAAGMSVIGKTISEASVGVDELEEQIIEWVDT